MDLLAKKRHNSNLIANQSVIQSINNLNFKLNAMSAQISYFSEGFEDYLKSLISEVVKESLQEFLYKEKVTQLSPTDPKKVYSRRQVAEIINRSENSVTKYIRQRKLVATRLNGIYYISETSLLNFINNTKHA